MQNLRLFAALAVPQDIAQRLAALPRQGIDGSWSAGDDFHITLRFVDEVAPAAVPDVIEALNRVKRPAFHVETGGLGSFALKRQFVLWAGVQSTRKMTALAADINDALTPLGFEMPSKPFVPHITLARLKSGKGLEEYIRRHKNRVGGSWQAAEFHLYRSETPGENEGHYNKLHSFPLTFR